MVILDRLGEVSGIRKTIEELEEEEEEEEEEEKVTERVSHFQTGGKGAERFGRTHDKEGGRGGCEGLDHDDHDDEPRSRRKSGNQTTDRDGRRR